MTDEGFWLVIEASRSDCDPQLRDGNMDRQAKRLEALLSEMSLAEVEAFRRVYAKVWLQAYTWDLWGAAYIIGGGCSDDSFMDFRDWLISMGRRVYEAALANPETLLAVVAQPGVESAFFEGFGYVSWQALERKGGGDVEWSHPQEPAGDKWDEESLPQLFPNLWNAYGDA